jgi:hypothetical protein
MKHSAFSILFSAEQKTKDQGKEKCHTKSMMSNGSNERIKIYTPYVPLRQNTEEEVRGKEIKTVWDDTNEYMKHEDRRKRNWSDSSPKIIIQKFILHGEHHRSFTVNVQEQVTNTFIIQESCSVHGYRYKINGVRTIEVNVSVMWNFDSSHYP